MLNMRTLFPILAPFLTLIFCSAAQAGSSLTEVARVAELQLSFEFQPQRIESLCDEDEFFAIEPFSVSSRWLCIVRDPGSNRMRVSKWGTMESARLIVRGPVDSDREILFVDGIELKALDPVTLARRNICNVADSPDEFIQSAKLFDRDGDGTFELVTTSSSRVEIRNIPDCQLLEVLTNGPWFNPAGRVFPGQFDDDPQWELAVISGGDSIEFYDGLSFAYQAGVALAPFSPVSKLIVLDWDDDGRHEIATNGNRTFFVVDLDSQVPVRSITGSSEAAAVQPIRWSGNDAVELALVRPNEVSIINPISDAIVHSEALSLDRFSPVLSFTADYDSDGLEDLLWQNSGKLDWLRNPTGVFPLQSGLQRFHVLESAGEQGDLATLDVMADGQQLSIRMVDDLSVITSWPLTADWETGAVGDFSLQSGEEVVLAREKAIMLISASTGATLWSRTNSDASFAWRRVSAPGACNGAGCRRIAIAENAVTDGLGGSRLVVLNGDSGVPIFEGPRDNCVGCGYQRIVQSDVTGDGFPEIVSLKWDVELGRDVVTVRDGATFGILWQSPDGVSSFIDDFEVTREQQPRVAILTRQQGLCQLDTFDAADGAFLETRQFNGFECAASSNNSLRYSSKGSGTGLWLIWNLDRGLQVIDDDTLMMVGRMRDSLRSIASMADGTFVVDVPGELRRLSVDALFADSFE